jgi:hypothetical protein
MGSLEDTSNSHRNKRAAIRPFGRDGGKRRYRNHTSSYMTSAELVIDGDIRTARPRAAAMAEALNVQRELTRAGQRNRSGDQSAYRSDH